MASLPTYFPPQTRSYILSFQFSSWYPRFVKHTIKSTIIRPVPPGFQEYLTSDGIFVPEGSDDRPPQSPVSESDDDDNDDNDNDNVETKITYSDANSDFRVKHWAFPELDKRIRNCIEEYEGVFPKLNFSSPKDAYWVLFNAYPLRCTSPSDVYILLKSSSFALHDTDVANVFSGCQDPTPEEENVNYELELILRKWYPIEPNRELRCFVRNRQLIAISQRDLNYYEFLNEKETKEKIVASVQKFWETEIKDVWEGSDYIFDFLLTRDLSQGHIIDFNPYSPRTDSLLFSYKELHQLSIPVCAGGSSSNPTTKPELRVIPSRSHPAAASNIPVFQHNMVPLEALTFGVGRTIGEFAEALQNGIYESMKEDDGDGVEEGTKGQNGTLDH